ncbi:MAG: hypothetical protein AAGE89_03905 [Pseudomonadota bacterium]
MPPPVLGGVRLRPLYRAFDGGGAGLFAPGALVGLLQGLRSLVFSQIGRWLDGRLSGDLVTKTVKLSVYKRDIGTQPGVVWQTCGVLWRRRILPISLMRPGW